MREQVTIEEVVEASLFALRAKMYKIMPGIVTKGGTATIEVQPAVHDVRFDPVLQTRVSEPWPVLVNVPVLWPKWGSFALVGTMSKGDKVLLLSPDLDPTQHQGAGVPTDPGDTARHAGRHWLALPADITEAASEVFGSPGAAAIFGNPGGVQVQVTASDVRLGSSNPSDNAALASILDSFIKVFLTNWTPVPNDGGAALKTALGAWVASTRYTSTASRTVKVAP